MRLPSFFLLLFLYSGISAQVDRYPYIQQPTETSALVAWRTANANIGTLSWGTSPGSLTNSMTDVSPVQSHDFTISGLQPNTQYYYQVTNAAGFSSSVEHFWTAKPGSVSAVNFLHYGDCGYDNNPQNDLADVMEQEDVDFALVAGDVDQGTGDNYDNVFFKVYKNMLARDCHYTAIGNHDIIANNGADFFDAFYQPTNNPQGVENYYSFTWGNAKFICLDSNIDYAPGSDQHNFLLDELRCNDHQWVFVFCHHPPWTNAWDPLYYIPLQPWFEYDGEDDMRTEIVPYLEQYGVDFMLNGHSHCYQRGSLNGVEYVISGGAGSPILDDRTCNTFPGFNSCAPNIQQEIFVHQFVRFELRGDTATYRCIDINGDVRDSVTLIKSWTPYSANLSATNAVGQGTNDGSATAAATGPHPPYTYQWSNGGSTGTINNLAPGTYHVTITSDLGCERVDSVVVGVGVGVSGPFEPISVTVQPNPFTEGTQLSFPNPLQEAFNLEIFDIDGKRMRRIEGITGESIYLDRGNLPAGIYLYQLSGTGKAQTGKILIQ
ncbi:MAG: T9SS type A sorting domain-containing protein [Bacteroidota bacterium]